MVSEKKQQQKLEKLRAKQVLATLKQQELIRVGAEKNAGLKQPRCRQGCCQLLEGSAQNHTCADACPW